MKTKSDVKLNFNFKHKMFIEYFINDKIEFVFPDCILEYRILSCDDVVVDFNNINNEPCYLHNITHPNQHNEVFRKLKLDPFKHMKYLLGDYHISFIKEHDLSQEGQSVPRFLTLRDVNKVIADLKKLVNSQNVDTSKNLKVTTNYELNDEIRITFPDNSVLIYNVKKYDDVYFLHNMRNAFENEEIFKKMHVKPLDYLRRVLGYADWHQITFYGSTYSTYCFKSLEDLNKVLSDIKKEIFSQKDMRFLWKVIKDDQAYEEKTKFSIKIPKININLNFKV